MAQFSVYAVAVKTFPRPLELALLAGVCFLSLQSSAVLVASPVPEATAPSLTLIANNGAGVEKHLISQAGFVGQLVIKPNQAVPVRLQFSSDKIGMPIAISSLDGGEINGDNRVVSPAGNVLFTFRGVAPGLYRVVVRLPTEQHRIAVSASIRSSSPDYDGPLGGLAYPEGVRVDLWTPDDPQEVINDVNGRHGPADILVNHGDGTRELQRADGGKVIFANSRAYAIIDPYGQTTTLTYDAAGKLWKVTEPGGRYLEFFYQNFTYWNDSISPGFWASEDVISMVQANDGRGNVIESVRYAYDTVSVGYYFPHRCYYLTHVYYDDGAQATYTYERSNIWNTPGLNYDNMPGVVHSCDDPRYAGAMKQIQYEYVHYTPSMVGQGQIKAEKNVNDQVVSQTSYPTSVYDPAYRQRTETRGDGATRSFNYPLFFDPAAPFIWTDFKNQPYTDNSSVSPPGWTVTDPRQNTTTYEVEPSGFGMLKKITHPGDGTTKEYSFSDPNNPHYHSGEKDENGNWTYYDRDPNTHQVTQIRYPDGSTEQFTYNGFGQVLTHKLRSGGTETVTYDARGLKATSYPPATESDLDPWNHPTRYTYYQAADGQPAWIDRLKAVQDPRGNTTRYEYNQRGQVTKVTHDQDGTYTQSHYKPDGTLDWTADENHPNASWNESERTRYTYDEYKRVLTVTNPMGQVTTNSYGLNPITWGDPLLHTTNSPKWTKSPMLKNVVYEYDANFRKIYQGVALGTADAAATFFEYDVVGNLTKVTDPRQNVTTFHYDQRNRKDWMDDPVASDRNSSGHTMNWEYDGVGNKKKETRADDVFRSWDYNSMNQLWHAYDWRTNETPTASQTTTYNRDSTGNLHEIVDQKGASYVYFYDALGRKASAFYPPDAQGTVRYEYFQYDAAGNLQRHDNPAGQVQWFVYDNRNRMNHSYWWGNVGPDITKSYDNASRLTSVTTNGGETTVAFGYDDANRQVWEEQTLAGYQTRRIETARDADGNRGGLWVYANGQPPYGVFYDYTQRNQLAHIYNGGWGQWFNYTYDAAGNLIKRQDVGMNDSEDCHPWNYDPLNRPVEWENTGGNDNPFARSWYQYDNVGREVATWRDFEGSKGERYWYDATNQLTNVRYNADQVWTGNPSNWDRGVDYAYTGDKLNRTSMNDNGTVTNYTTSAMNQYVVNGATYNYDGNFNLREAPNWGGGFDAQNQLMSAGHGGNVAFFTYDGLGRCVRRITYAPDSSSNTVLYTYDGWKAVEEWDGAGNFHAWNIYGAGADEILWRYSVTGGHLRYHHDIHGNVTALLGPNAEGLERYTYDAFGKPKITDWSGNPRVNGGGEPLSAYDNRFMFQGREYIPELAIYDYRHRYYQPELGRFLQIDPTGFDAGDMNLFRYVGDDPVDRGDPEGLESDAELEQMSIKATLRAASDYAQDSSGLGKAVWGAHRKDGTGYKEFPANATIMEGWVSHGPIRRWEGYEVETAPKVDTTKYDYWAYVGHVHGKKGEKDFSRKDRERVADRVVVTRADAADIGPDGKLKPGHTVKRAGRTARNDRDVYKQPGTIGSSGSPSISPGMKAALDYASLYLGIAQGAESINIVNGRP